MQTPRPLTYWVSGLASLLICWRAPARQPGGAAFSTMICHEGDPVESNEWVPAGSAPRLRVEAPLLRETETLSADSLRMKEMVLPEEERPEA